MLNFNEIEAKWQKAWDEAKVFEPEPKESEPYMVTAAFPYANAPQHIGHLRTYGTADALARYKRMRGRNVLFPMAFHATGTPVLAFAKRIRNNDKDLIEELKTFHVPDEDIAKMTDPVYIANYFVGELEKGMHKAGYSIDWRRRFVSIDPFFSKFVEWQFGILNSKHYLTQGRHPVGWCPNENNAVGMHDTKHDVEPEIEKETALRFKVDGEESYVLCSTFRPETVFGVTNLFVGEGYRYVLCRIENWPGTYYVSKAASEALKYQFSMEVVRELDAAELLGKTCVNPMTGAKIGVLPGFFVKEDVGTGAVMSVPAHAPFDYAALQRLRAKGVTVPDPIKVIDVKIGRSLSESAAGEAKPAQIDIPALAYLEVLHTDVNSIDDMLELATKLEYKEESHWGKMAVKGYEGMSEPEAREKVATDLASRGEAVDLHVLQNAPVYCRCGYKVVVKMVDNQWFLNYGDKGWKQQVNEWVTGMSILPDKVRKAISAAIDWIDLRAVARAQGLGTPFTLDKNFIIESLSDSTIYPAFYTIANVIRDVEVSKLKPEFFDYVFLGKGDVDAVSKSTGIDYEVISKSRDSFAYWYRDTSRHSGPDLVPNHLIMYIFNHIAVFGKEYWPKQIVVNGFVMCEGEKMSKSLGNIVPLVDGIAKYGADPMRMNELAGTDLYSDVDFSSEAVRGIQERLDYLYNKALDLDSLSAGELRQIDYWLYSKLNGKIEAATKAMETLEMRDAYMQVFYNSVLELKQYFVRGGNNSVVVKDYLTAVALMLQPVTPHFAEEMWHALGNDTFVSLEKWPATNAEMANDKAERGEELVTKVLEDAKQVIAMMQKKGGAGSKAKELRIIVADDWKREMSAMLATEKDVGKVLEAVKAIGKVDMARASAYAGSLAKRINEVEAPDMTSAEEFAALNEAAEYMGSMLKCSVAVEAESDSKSQRAQRAMPLKPSLDISFEK